MGSSGTNYVFNEPDDFDQYGPYAIPYWLMPCYNHPESLVCQKWITIELLC